ncbi:PREDICTED: pyruvate dehydrogenase phosphatase regulatory subunit, mitochondrial-like [Acropora digitifera]|uniref:pyruvate dehydrogenase phosphatase regulatory subunit, mitochondrial-like n=1 Tax=Acropora digitifera TaxID=70779 RepID=UPI00077A4D6E|nr:PREDICTED: pyruvate dehydrogenase phosphatase regulatory subunit, mitochondrial-like [Acropora digitifera]
MWLGFLKAQSRLFRNVPGQSLTNARSPKALFARSLFKERKRCCFGTSQQRHLNSDASLPKEAEIVICGGGIVGCSVAYHLAKLGWRDVLLLEQGSLTCGTTWHAAGLLGKLRSTAIETKLSSYSVELYSTLEYETGVGTGFKRCGGLLVAQSKERLTLFKRRAAIGRSLNIDCEVLSASEIPKVFPLDLRTDDLVVRNYWYYVTAIWAWQLGQKCEPKVSFPLHSTEHFYIVTKPLDVPSMMPALRDHDGQIFIREWSGGLLSGGFEAESLPVFHEGIPKGFEFQLLPENWEHFGPMTKKMLHRLPLMENAQIRYMTNGPESFTPDSRYFLGEVPEAGMALAEWITAGEPTMDLSSVDIGRFASHHNNKRFLRECVKETLGWHYHLRFPYSERMRARGVRCSPLYSDLDDAGASWGEKMGWEVAKWFSLRGDGDQPKSGFGKPGWLDSTGVEYKACIEAVGVVDMTCLGLFEIESPIEGECETFLQYVCSNDVCVSVDHTVDTLMLNKRGGIELKCTVIKTTPYRFLILLHDAESVTFAQSLISKNIPADSAITLRNIQSGNVILGVLGPNSHHLVQSLTQTSLDADQFSTNAAQVVDLGYASGVRTFRTSCFGNQANDWQLLVPSEVSDLGSPLRLEIWEQFGFHSNEYRRRVPTQPLVLLFSYTVSTIFFLCAFADNPQAQHDDSHFLFLPQNQDFIGKQALLESLHPSKHLVHLTLLEHDDNNFPWGGEVILRNGSFVGSTTSACYSFRDGRPVCLGYLVGDGKNSSVPAGDFQIEIAGSLFSVSVTNL